MESRRIRRTSDNRRKYLWLWIVKYVYEILILLILLIGVILFSLDRNYETSAPIDASLWGQFGDYVGGIIGSLIAYVSVRLLNRNLQEQIEANKAIRQNNEDSRKVFELQQFDKTFTTLIELYCERKKELDEIKLDDFDKYNCKKKTYKDRVEEAKGVFSKFYVVNRSVLSAYFRLLYRIMQTIGEAHVDECVKLRYAKIFRSLLTGDELFLLRYNAMTYYGNKMQPYINQYNLLKHMPLMRLLEFHFDSVSTFSPQYKDLFDNIFLDVRKFLINTLCQISEENKFEKKYKSSDARTFRVLVGPDSSGKSGVKIAVEYTTAGTSAEGRIVKDEAIILLLEYFMSEIFVHVSFGYYQKAEKIQIQADSNSEKRSRKHTIWATISHTENFPLVLSQAQLSEPGR